MQNSKRPKEMSRDELEALPEALGYFDETLPSGHKVRRPVVQQLAVSVKQPDDMAFVRLSDGVYSFAQGQDGEWYKRRIYL